MTSKEDTLEEEEVVTRKSVMHRDFFIYERENVYTVKSKDQRPRRP